jgi:hypothetical protein
MVLRDETIFPIPEDAWKQTRPSLALLPDNEVWSCGELSTFYTEGIAWRVCTRFGSSNFRTDRQFFMKTERPTGATIDGATRWSTSRKKLIAMIWPTSGGARSTAALKSFSQRSSRISESGS